jgi:hypothetical protein
MNVASLEAARNKARSVASHSRVSELRAILGSSSSTVAEKRAAQTELIALRKDRQALQAKHASSVAAAQAALTAGRRSAQADARNEAAAKLRDVPTEQLVERRAKLTEQRKALKLEMGAVVAALGERQAEERVADLVSTLSDPEKKRLLQQLQAGGVPSAEAVGVPGGS